MNWFEKLLGIDLPDFSQAKDSLRERISGLIPKEPQEPKPQEPEPQDPQEQIRQQIQQTQEQLPQVAEEPIEEPENTPEQEAWVQYNRPPSNPYHNILEEVFGEMAPQMNEVLRWGIPDNEGYGVNYGGENLSFDPTAVNVNEDGSKDIGLYQINDATFNDFMRRKGDQLRAAGVDSAEDLLDPRLNAIVAKFILEEQGIGAWYGRKK